MDVLGSTHHALCQDKEAQEMLELALEKRQVLGDNHPETTRTLSSLAIIYQELGHMNKALELAMSAVRSKANFWEKIMQ
jgi:hypothetical protein